MTELQPPDSHFLSAASGWLGLGDPVEAEAELDQINQKFRSHPQVLEVKWAIYAEEDKWERCIEVARELTKSAPKDSFGWIHLSFALHELKRTREAYDNLEAVLKKFPKEWLLSYNLACYACQLGDLEDAGKWLAGAIVKKGDEKSITRMAAKDPDLAPLFTEEKEL